MRDLRQIWRLFTHLGPGWVLFRFRYALRRKLGALRKATPAAAWPLFKVERLALRARPLPPPLQIGADCEEETRALAEGKFRLFSHHEVTLGSPPDWHRNALTREKVPADRHWSLLGDFAFGDIKAVWEVNRFGWAYALARAERRRPDPRHAALFWGWFDDWCAQNPPNLGPNWMCGQEAFFRLMAVLFAAEVLGVPDARRRDLLARFVLATGRRIAANLDYALSQKNNHGVSECAGLITAALALPDAPESPPWLARGLDSLRAQLAELVYPDGAFSQHSLIYHRVLLHDLAWIADRLKGAARALPEWLVSAAARAHGFARRLVDPATGEAPLFGTNDGANILPLTRGAFNDLRPALRALEAAFGWTSTLPPGPWDEAALWMQNEAPANPPASPPTEACAHAEDPWHAPHGGYLDWKKTGGDRAFMRCPTRFKHRPAQADMLHLDIWLAGRPVAVDGGSFSYNSTERFTQLARARYHNVVTVADIEPLKKFGRFLYLPWPKGAAGPTGDRQGWRASHDGYSALGVKWTRELQACAGGWKVVDRVECTPAQTLRWHWLLVDAAWELGENECRTAQTTVRWSASRNPRATLHRSDADTAYGWRSLHYAAVEPAVSLVLDFPATNFIELTTEFIRSQP